jgi:uncharacterized protein YeaO (DUF488 family)
VRVLVDRLWPRGLSKEAAGIDEWARPVTPSGELRKWFHANGERYEEFARRYREELASPEVSGEVDRLAGLAAERVVTLLTAVKDPEHSHVPVLLGVLRGDSPP